MRLVKVNESHSVMSDSLRPHGLYSPWNSPGLNTGVGSRSLLHGIFPTQGSNPSLQHLGRFYCLSHHGSPDHPSKSHFSLPCLPTLSFKYTLNHIKVWKGSVAFFRVSSRETDLLYMCCLLRVLTPTVMTTFLMPLFLMVKASRYFCCNCRKSFWVEGAPLLHLEQGCKICSGSPGAKCILSSSNVSTWDSLHLRGEWPTAPQTNW